MNREQFEAESGVSCGWATTYKYERTQEKRPVKVPRPMLIVDGCAPATPAFEAVAKQYIDDLRAFEAEHGDAGLAIVGMWSGYKERVTLTSPTATHTYIKSSNGAWVSESAPGLIVFREGTGSNTRIAP